MLSILDRYLLRDVALAFLATLVVLLGVLITSRLGLYLDQAASGVLSPQSILVLVALQSVRFAALIAPLALLLGIMLTLGRLYRDHEMAALNGCGFGPWAVYRPLLWLAIPLALVLAVGSFHVVPAALSLHADLQTRARDQSGLALLTPGNFKELAGGRQVIYVEGQKRGTATYSRVFVHSRDADSLAITSAGRGEIRADADGVRYLELGPGYRYSGQPGALGYDTMAYAGARVRLDSGGPEAVARGREALPTAALLADLSPAHVGELHGRLAGPVSVLLLVALAPLLARAHPREGRYGRVVAGVLVYAVYFNLLGVGQAWIEQARLPGALGLWPVHALLLAAVVVLWLRAYGWPRRGDA